MMEHDLFKEGRAALDAAHYSIAKEKFLEALDDDPLCAYGLYALVKIGAIESETECNKLEEAFLARYADILRLADEGDDEACFVIGVCHEKGLIQPNDADKMLFYYEKSYSAGNLRAGFNLACCLYEQRDLKRAIQIYDKLSDTFMAEARVNLGYIYLTETEFLNVEKGVMLLERAALQGDDNAHFLLGMTYLTKSSDIYDAKKGFEHLKCAAESGNPSAVMRLAECYETGEGTQRNLKIATQLIRGSAKSDAGKKD